MLEVDPWHAAMTIISQKVRPQPKRAHTPLGAHFAKKSAKGTSRQLQRQSLIIEKQEHEMAGVKFKCDQLTKMIKQQYEEIAVLQNSHEGSKIFLDRATKEKEDAIKKHHEAEERIVWHVKRQAEILRNFENVKKNYIKQEKAKRIKLYEDFKIEIEVKDTLIE